MWVFFVVFWVLFFFCWYSYIWINMKRSTQTSVNILPHAGVGGGLTLKDFKNSPVMSPNQKDTPDTKRNVKRTNWYLARTQLVKEFGIAPQHPHPTLTPTNPPIKVMYDQRMDVPLSEHCVWKCWWMEGWGGEHEGGEGTQETGRWQWWSVDAPHWHSRQMS